MSEARRIYERERIDSHTFQFRATILVLQYLSRYKTLHIHRDRIMAILNK